MKPISEGRKLFNALFSFFIGSGLFFWVWFTEASTPAQLGPVAESTTYFDWVFMTILTGLVIRFILKYLVSPITKYHLIKKIKKIFTKK